MNKDVGFAYPFRFDGGRVATVGGINKTDPTNDDRDAAVRAGVTQVLLTERGERVMFGDFGAGLSRWLFSPIPGFMSLIPMEVRRSVEAWCPRAVVSNASLSGVENGEVVVAVVVRHNDADSESIIRVAARTT